MIPKFGLCVHLMKNTCFTKSWIWMNLTCICLSISFSQFYQTFPQVRFSGEEYDCCNYYLLITLIKNRIMIINYDPPSLLEGHIALHMPLDGYVGLPHLEQQITQEHFDQDPSNLIDRKYMVSIWSLWIFRSVVQKSSLGQEKKNVCIFRRPTDPNFWPDLKLFYGTFSRKLLSTLFLPSKFLVAF